MILERIANQNMTGSIVPCLNDWCRCIYLWLNHYLPRKGHECEEKKKSYVTIHSLFQ